MENSLIYRRGIPGYIYLFNYVMNRVPSDIFRIKNPKVVKKVREGENGEEIVYFE